MIKKHTNGVFQQNTWIYINELTMETIVVDPGDDIDNLLDMIGEGCVTHIFITHGHIDHIQGLETLSNNYPNAVITAHEYALETLPNPTKNLSIFFGLKVVAPQPNWTYNSENALISAAGQEWQLIYTPGHAVDHTIFLGEDQTLFSGDLIFEQGGTGRVDFPGCDQDMMRKSINKLLSYSDNILLYPGHGSSFKLGEAKRFFN